ncbi:hypothetical protein ACFE04_005293 [Oxalis oulophora]
MSMLMSSSSSSDNVNTNTNTNNNNNTNTNTNNNTNNNNGSSSKVRRRRHRKSRNQSPAPLPPKPPMIPKLPPPMPISPVQKLYETCKVVFANTAPGIVPTPENVQKLKMVLDEMKPTDFGLRTEFSYMPLTSNRKSRPVSYLRVHECNNFEIAIFCLPPKSVIPLHNHPGMSVFSKLLFGDLHIKSYDWVPGVSTGSSTSKNPKTRLAKLKLNSVFKAPCSPTILYPAAEGNIHCLTAKTSCAVLDVLGPPYSEPDGRDCEYFDESPFEAFSEDQKLCEPEDDQSNIPALSMYPESLTNDLSNNSDSSSPPHSRRAERIRRRKRRSDSSSPPSFESDETNVLGFLSATSSAIRPLATTTFREGEAVLCGCQLLGCVVAVEEEGPGCSSLGFGAFMENGPFQPGPKGHLVNNKYSWNLVSNMLYVESPIGVGFSYSNTSTDYENWNDTQTGKLCIFWLTYLSYNILIVEDFSNKQSIVFFTAQDNLHFIVKWLDEFPQYKNSDFFLAGESYAGHYIPQLAALLIEHNKKAKTKPIKLKSIALGNPLLDLDISVLAGNFLWSHGAISDETLMLEKTVCNDSNYVREHAHGEVSSGCNEVFDRVHTEVSSDVDSDNILSLQCLMSTSSSVQQLRTKGKHEKIHEMIARMGMNGDPCLADRIFTYLSTPQVQKALHANTTRLSFDWNFCGGGPLMYQDDNLDMNLIPLVADLIKEGISVLLYSGDQDSKIPVTQTRIIANNIAKDLKLVALTQYRTWYDKKQVGGWWQSFGSLKDGKNVTGLTFATVRGAAHEVPFTSPSQALTLFKSFVSGSSIGA